MPVARGVLGVTETDITPVEYLVFNITADITDGTIKILKSMMADGDGNFKYSFPDNPVSPVFQFATAMERNTLFLNNPLMLGSGYRSTIDSHDHFVLFDVANGTSLDVDIDAITGAPSSDQNIGVWPDRLNNKWMIYGTARNHPSVGEGIFLYEMSSDGSSISLINEQPLALNGPSTGYHAPYADHSVMFYGSFNGQMRGYMDLRSGVYTPFGFIHPDPPGFIQPGKPYMTMYVNGLGDGSDGNGEAYMTGESSYRWVSTNMNNALGGTVRGSGVVGINGAASLPFGSSPDGTEMTYHTRTAFFEIFITVVPVGGELNPVPTTVAYGPGVSGVNSYKVSG